MPSSPEEQAVTMIRNLVEKTGVEMKEWIQRARDLGEAKHGAMVKRLKAEHGLTHGYANLVAHKTLASDAAEADNDPVAAQYSGRKAGLRPVYDALLNEIHRFGPELEISPKKTYVSLRRKKQFALIQPSTATRVDVGIQLKGKAPTKRLEASGSFNAMVSHRVRLTESAEVDAELINWLRAAFDRAE